MRLDQTAQKLSYEYPLVRPLGRVLRKADIISKSQVRLALKNQEQFEYLRMGEILVLHGWVKQETVDFFAEKWPSIIKKGADQPLGSYLKASGLLNDEQIDAIIKEQNQLGLKFGSVAVLRGWIKQTTLDFLLVHLAPQEYTQSGFIGKKTSSKSEAKQVLYVSEVEISVPKHHPHTTNNCQKKETDILELAKAVYDSMDNQSEEDYDLANSLDKNVPWFKR